MIKRPIPRIRRAKKNPSPSNISVKFKPSNGIQSTRAITTSPARTVGRLVNRPIKAASETVNVTPAVDARPAEFIKPGSNAPKNGKATIKKRNTRIPNLEMFDFRLDVMGNQKSTRESDNLDQKTHSFLITRSFKRNRLLQTECQ